MRIGVDFHVDTRIYQGTRTYLGHLIEALMKVDRQNTYLLFNADYSEGEVSPQAPNFIRKKLRTNSGKFNLLCGFSEAARKHRLDIFHTNYMTPFSMPCRTVVTIHDILPEVMPQYFPLVHRIQQKSLVPCSARKADAVIAVSRYTRDLICGKYGVRPEKITVTYEAAAPCFRPIRRGDNTFFRSHGITNDYILTVGRLAPVKNIPGMLIVFSETLKRIRHPFQFVIVGQKDPVFPDRSIERILDDLKLRDKVLFLNQITDTDLVQFYNGALAFLFLSHGEGFGLPVVEAMACGLPVIASSTTACDEIAGEAARKVHPEDLPAAVEALTSLLCSDKIRIRLREKGIARAASFSWEKCAAETLFVYEKCLERS